jgi:hypothetical protein
MLISYTNQYAVPGRFSQRHGRWIGSKGKQEEGIDRGRLEVPTVTLGNTYGHAVYYTKDGSYYRDATLNAALTATMWKPISRSSTAWAS